MTLNLQIQCIYVFHENPSNGSRFVPCGRTDGRTDRQTDMMKLIVVFRNFANIPKNQIPVHQKTLMKWRIIVGKTTRDRVRLKGIYLCYLTELVLLPRLYNVVRDGNNQECWKVKNVEFCIHAVFAWKWVRKTWRASIKSAVNRVRSHDVRHT